MPRYPRYNRLIDTRAPRRVISALLGGPRHAEFRVLTPIMHNHGKRFTSLLRLLHNSNCTHTLVSNRRHRLSSSVGLAGRGGRAVRIIISHLVVHSNVQRQLASSVRATLQLSGNIVITSFISLSRGSPGQHRPFSRRETYPGKRRLRLSRVRPHAFSFGTPCKTYPIYSNVNCGLRVSPSLIVTSSSGSLSSNIVRP